MAHALAYRSVDNRAVERDEVHYRTRGLGPDAKLHSLLIVDMSPMGMMARTDATYQAGEKLRVTLPIAGTLVAEVRWTLGGRMGFLFERPIDMQKYYEVLATLRKPR